MHLARDGSNRWLIAHPEIKTFWGLASPPTSQDLLAVWLRYPREALQKLSLQLARAAEQAEVCSVLLPYRHPDGRPRQHLLQIRPLPRRRRKGKQLWQGLWTDVSACEALAHQDLKRLQTVIEQASDAVVITELAQLESRIVYVNRAYTQMTGYTAEEVLGQNPRFLQGPKSDRQVLEKVKAAVKAHKACQAEIINYKKNGETFWHHFSIAPVFDADGHCTHFIGVSRDFTEPKHKEQRLLLQAQLAQIFSRADDLKQALKQSLSELLQSTGFELAECWLLEPDGQRIRPAAIVSDKPDYAPFINLTRTLPPFVCGEGLPGMIWARNQPQLWQKIHQNPCYLRYQIAAETGLQCAFGVPLNVGEAFIGVLLLYASHNHSFASDFAPVSQELGDFLAAQIQRRQAENSIQHHNRMLRILAKLNQVLLEQSGPEQMLRDALPDISQFFQAACAGYIPLLPPHSDAGPELPLIAWADGGYHENAASLQDLQQALFKVIPAAPAALKTATLEATLKQYFGQYQLQTVLLFPLQVFQNIQGCVWLGSDDVSHILDDVEHFLENWLRNLSLNLEHQLFLSLLTASEKHYSDLFHFNPYPMWVYACKDQRFLNVNQAALAHYAYTREAFMALQPQQLVAQPSAETPPIPEQYSDRLIQYHQGKTGEPFAVELRLQQIHYAGCQAELVMAQDITRELRFLQQQDKHNQTLKQIIWIQCHRVRAPLSKILGLVALLSDTGCSPAEAQLFLQALQTASQELDQEVHQVVRAAERAL